MKTIVFPYYSGNINFTKVIGHVNLNSFIHSIKNPKPRTINIINEIHNCQSQKEKRELKQNLFSFTPSVFIHKGQKRNYENIVYYTRLMQLDFDKIESKQKALDIKNYVFEQKEIVCVFTSPSGKGVKALALIKEIKNKEQYKAVFNSINEKYESTGYFDTATKNAVLPLFLSIDKNILHRDVNSCQPWNEEKYIEINYNNLNEEKIIHDKQSSYYEKITIDIFARKIQSINESGHPQVRSACLILGSRAAAGYVSLTDAELNAEYYIKNNEYLSKGTTGYLQTAKWAIHQGYQNPKYYK